MSSFDGKVTTAEVLFDSLLFFYRSGQSNPTFYLVKNGKEFVLRKKPPGKLLRGAHQVNIITTCQTFSTIRKSYK